jgi:hypothetical protein
MDVASLWIVRKDSDIPELLVAWDGWSIEENYDGWERACKDALAAVGDDVRGHRYVNLSVPDDPLVALFDEFKTVRVERVSQLEDPAAI